MHRADGHSMGQLERPQHTGARQRLLQISPPAAPGRLRLVLPPQIPVPLQVGHRVPRVSLPGVLVQSPDSGQERSDRAQDSEGGGWRACAPCSAEAGEG